MGRGIRVLSILRSIPRRCCIRAFVTCQVCEAQSSDCMMHALNICMRWCIDVGARNMCLSLWNLDQATASRRCISLSVLSPRVKCRPKTGIPVLLRFFPGRHFSARLGRSVMYDVLSLLICSPPSMSALSACCNIWAASSGELATMMRSSTKIRWERVWWSILKPAWLAVHLSWRGERTYCMARMKSSPLSGAPCLLPRFRGMSSSGWQPQMCGVILLPRSSLQRLKMRRGWMWVVKRLFRIVLC